MGVIVQLSRGGGDRPSIKCQNWLNKITHNEYSIIFEHLYDS